MFTSLRQRGLTLIELIMFIVIVGVALAGVLTVLNYTTQKSADPMVRKQTLAIAEALLEEVMLQSFTLCDPDDTAVATAYINSGGTTVGCTTAEGLGPEGSESRGTYDNVSDYVQSGGSAISAISGDTYGLGDPTHAIRNIVNNAFVNNASAPLGYTATIKVEQSSLNGIPASASLLITVSVSGPGETIQVQGYRTRHSPNMPP